jgi:ABC-type glycerol-3-phosphate transport system permease component
MAIYAMVQSGSAQPWSYLGSLVLIMSAPVVAIFLLLQHTMLDRMMFGAAND